MKNKFFINVFLNGMKYGDFLIENPSCLKNEPSEWYDEFKNDKNLNIVNRLRSLYNAKDFKSNNIKFSAFYQWYQKQSQCCKYCSITQNEIDQLFELNQVQFTRGGKRGRNLEIDRKLSKIDYGSDFNNLVLSCYWCNNAKTDEFSYEEFKPVGVAIGNILKNRLKNNDKRAAD